MNQPALDLAQRLELAHAALFKEFARPAKSPTSVAYLDENISVKVTPHAQSKATAMATVRTGLSVEITAPNEGTASYLVLDLISAVRSGEVMKATECGCTTSAMIEVISGYPTVVGWEPQSSL